MQIDNKRAVDTNVQKENMRNTLIEDVKIFEKEFK